MRDALQVTLRVLTVASQKVFMANTFGDGYIVKKMACHPERSEGTQRWILCKKNDLSSRPEGGNSATDIM